MAHVHATIEAAHRANRAFQQQQPVGATFEAKSMGLGVQIGSNVYTAEEEEAKVIRAMHQKLEAKIRTMISQKKSAKEIFDKIVADGIPDKDAGPYKIRLRIRLQGGTRQGQFNYIMPTFTAKVPRRDTVLPVQLVKIMSDIFPGVAVL